MADFLTNMARASLTRVHDRLEPSAQKTLASKLESRVPPEPFTVQRPGIIAEIKNISPSEGRLSRTSCIDRIQSRAQAYETGGALALSVLTEPTAFGGSLEHLQAVAASVELPVMRKDFLVHPIQIDEAAAFGASGVLLIARLVPLRVLRQLVVRARQLDLFVLLEVFDKDDIVTAKRVMNLHPNLLIGLNTRDLATLTVRPNALQALAHHLPRHCIRVAESGLRTPADVHAARAMGFQLHLVGSALMHEEDPIPLLTAMTHAAQTEEAA